MRSRTRCTCAESSGGYTGSQAFSTRCVRFSTARVAHAGEMSSATMCSRRCRELRRQTASGMLATAMYASNTCMRGSTTARMSTAIGTPGHRLSTAASPAKSTSGRDSNVLANLAYINSHVVLVRSARVRAATAIDASTDAICGQPHSRIISWCPRRGNADPGMCSKRPATCLSTSRMSAGCSIIAPAVQDAQSNVRVELR